MKKFYNSYRISLIVTILFFCSFSSLADINYSEFENSRLPEYLLNSFANQNSGLLVQANPPVAVPSSGTYTGTQLVTLTTSSTGASIRYTTDDTDPSTTLGTLYSGPVSISSNTVLKSIAYGTGFTDSPVVSAIYIINCETPVLSPASGTYPTGQHVTMSTATAGATLYYTTDGTQPTSASTPYSSRITLNSNTTLRVVAIKNGMGDSQITTENYTILSIVETPAFTPPAGNYNAVQNVTIVSATLDATIYYTIDGTTPNSNSLKYTGPVNVATNLTVKAVAMKNGMLNSTISTATYTIQILKTSNPVFTPAPGNFTTPQSITISNATPGSTIKYTTDGTTPSQTNGIIYTIPVSIIASANFKAIAFNQGYTDSDVVSAEYKITLGDADSDGDRVSDNEDEFPIDPLRASNNLFPADGFGSLAFEDNWPSKADYDMNDMVIDYQFNQITNAKNEVVEIKARVVLRANGTNQRNGFGIEFPVSPSQVNSCEIKKTDGTPVSLGSSITLSSNGLESSNNPKAIVILFDDGYKLFPQNTPESLINTSPDIAWSKPDTLYMTITFALPVSMDVFAKNRFYNPFIFNTKLRSKEIHLPDFAPTSLADITLFNTGDDKSDPSIGKYYKTANNLPWAINIYEEYNYPVEKTSIMDAFLHFATWAQSNGTLYPDWYKIKDGYIKPNAVYIHP